jgi:predicted metal-binding membrane protein
VGDSLLTQVVRRDRLVVVGSLAAISLIAWAYLLAGAGMEMDMTMDMSMVMPMSWTPQYAAVVFVLWWIMMIAIMLPSAAPKILLFATVNRRSREQGNPYVPTGLFASGYLIAWGAFSITATLLHWLLDRAGLMSMDMSSASTWLGALLLVSAGIYQLTPLKYACLRNCRSPLEFVMRYWRPGRAGALRMGIRHGAYCVGCCWVVMGLLFYGGVMNIYWIVGLSVLVLLEKVLPGDRYFGYLSGIAFLTWGLWLAFSALAV